VACRVSRPAGQAGQRRGGGTGCHGDALRRGAGYLGLPARAGLEGPAVRAAGPGGCAPAGRACDSSTREHARLFVGGYMVHRIFPEVREFPGKCGARRIRVRSGTTSHTGSAR